MECDMNYKKIDLFPGEPLEEPNAKLKRALDRTLAFLAGVIVCGAVAIAALKWGAL